MVAMREEVTIWGDLYDSGSYCGASLIALDPPTILTAAHCVDGVKRSGDQDYSYYGNYYCDASDGYADGYCPVQLLFDINRTDADEIVDGDSFQRLKWNVSQLTIHENWNTSDIAKGYDIAIIVVDDGQNFTFSEDDLPLIPTTDLAGSVACCDDGDELEAIGYGLNHSEGTGTDTLEHTTLEFVDVDDCMENILGSYWASVYDLDNKVVCAVAPSGEKTDTCQGDSG